MTSSRATPPSSGCKFDCYLGSRAIRDLLGWTRSQLCYRMKRGDFPRPDLVVGDRGHMWKRSTLDTWAASHSRTSAIA